MILVVSVLLVVALYTEASGGVLSWQGHIHLDSEPHQMLQYIRIN